MNKSSVTYELLGGEIEIVAYDLDQKYSNFILENINIEGIRLEKIFNFYDSNSELSKLNKERRINPSPELFEVLSISLEFAKKFPKYNPLFGKNILRLKNNEKNISSYNFTDSILVSKDFVEIKNDHVLIDFGSIAKGYIADKLVEVMKEEGIISGFIDARGDLITFGEHYEIVKIPSPRNSKDDTIGIKLEDSAIATSGNHSQGKHILYEGDFESISIISDNLMYADMFSTICFTMLEDELEKFSEEYPEIKIHAITKNQMEKDYNGFMEMERKIRIRNEEIRKTRSS